MSNLPTMRAAVFSRYLRKGLGLSLALPPVSARDNTKTGRFGGRTMSAILRPCHVLPNQPHVRKLFTYISPQARLHWRRWTRVLHCVRSAAHRASVRFCLLVRKCSGTSNAPARWSAAHLSALSGDAVLSIIHAELNIGSL